MRQRKHNTTSSEEYRLIWSLKDQGKQTHEILKALGQHYGETRWPYSESSKAKLRRIVREKAGLGQAESRVKQFDQLEPRFKKMVGPYRLWVEHHKDCSGCEDDELLVTAAARGYELFFNEFSGREMAPHAFNWVRDAFRFRRLLLNVPPRHAKSTYLSVWMPLFLVCADRNIQILLISQTDDFAQKFCLEIVEHFEHDDEMIKAFGRFVPEEASWPWAPREGELMVAGRERLRLPGDRTIQIRGARQQILGMEADWLIVDDADSPDIVRSEINRKRFREWFDGQVITRLNPRGTAVYIGQRLHPLDLYGYLEKKVRTKTEGKPRLWTVIKYPAVLKWPTSEEAAVVLWPEQWPYDELMYAYDELGEYGFATMYQQDPSPMGTRLIKQEWIEGDETHPGCLDAARVVGQGFRDIEKDKMFIPMVRVLSVDPSPTQNWGFTIADVPFYQDHDRFEALIVYTEGKRHSVQEAKEKIEYLIKVFGPIDYLVWEWSAVSNWLESDPWYQELSRQMRVIPHKTHGKSKGDPEYGIGSLAIEFEFGRIRFPYGDAESRRMTEAFLEECWVWPDGEYDDQLMSLWFIKYVSRALYPSHLLDDMEMEVVGTAFDTREFSGAWSYGDE